MAAFVAGQQVGLDDLTAIREFLWNCCFQQAKVT
jgi:hypothetical protein